MTNRWIRAVRLAVLAALLTALGPAAARADSGPAPCQGLGVAATCGTVTVPVDRGDPQRGTIDVAYALVPRRDTTTPSAGTVAYNPGGPGAGAIAQAAELSTGLFAPLLDHRELLLVDPRGTGRSEPLACPSLAPEHAWQVGQAAATGECGSHLGDRVGAYGSAAVADDLDAVRAALGLGPLDLWGDSYGSYLMPVYAARHPSQVRSIVLSGAYPLDFDPWGRPQIAAARRAVRLVCTRAQACDGNAVLRDVARLARRLRRHPLPLTVRFGDLRLADRVDEEALGRILYAPLSADVFGQLPSAVAGALAGDPARIKQLAANTRLTVAALSGQDPETVSVFSSAANAAVQCHDYPRVFSLADPPAVRQQAFDQALAALDPAAFRPLSPAGWIHAGFEGSDSCIAWPNDPTAGRPLPPGTAMPDVPVLALAGDLDTNTPSAMGREAAAQFPHGRFAEVANAGHTASDSECGAELGLRFVVTLQADVQACRDAGEPLDVAGRDPRLAADLQPVAGTAPEPQRRAVAAVVATYGDVVAQLPTLSLAGQAPALRAGGYQATSETAFAIRGARVVRDVRAAGAVRIAGGRLVGHVRLSGDGVATGSLRVVYRGGGRGTASGTLDGQPVSFSFGS
ncbi:alpha/beta fold hydrolase [Patulibacter defluvii]|uniref:alpha/beta fold hydrolase n=1 Tax=Patulibacter defluvii TaxID=3095358 RepID=UPI002A7638A6|nr:alpha/beta fold hydrolase [Patulibacter sp. DM4]